MRAGNPHLHAAQSSPKITLASCCNLIVCCTSNLAASCLPSMHCLGRSRTAKLSVPGTSCDSSSPYLVIIPFQRGHQKSSSALQGQPQPHKVTGWVARNANSTHLHRAPHSKMHTSHSKREQNNPTSAGYTAHCSISCSQSSSR